MYAACAAEQRLSSRSSNLLEATWSGSLAHEAYVAPSALAKRHHDVLLDGYVVWVQRCARRGVAAQLLALCCDLLGKCEALL